MDLKTFIARAVQARLMSADALERIVAEFLAGVRAPNSTGSDLYALGDLLVHCDHLTRWQFDAMLKGDNDFHFANFKLLEVMFKADSKETYLAEDTNAGHRVTLTFATHPTDDVATLFEIVPIDGGTAVPVDLELRSSLRWRRKSRSCPKI